MERDPAGRLRPSPAAQQLIDNVGAAIARMAKARGLSQEALAPIAAMDSSGLSKIVRGKVNTSLGVLHRLADALGCDLVVELVPRPGSPLPAEPDDSGTAGEQIARHLATVPDARDAAADSEGGEA